MSENNEVKATEIAETSGYAALANMDTVNSALAEDCDGLDLVLIKSKSLLVVEQHLKCQPMRKVRQIW